MCEGIVAELVGIDLGDAGLAYEVSHAKSSHFSTGGAAHPLPGPSGPGSRQTSTSRPEDAQSLMMGRSYKGRHNSSVSAIQALVDEGHRKPVVDHHRQWMCRPAGPQAPGSWMAPVEPCIAEPH